MRGRVLAMAALLLVGVSDALAGPGPWVSPVMVSQPGAATIEPRLAMAPDGATTAVWIGHDGTNDVVQTALRAPGATSFGDPRIISQPGYNTYDPGVVTAPDGTTTVVWRHDDGSSGAVHAAVRSPGATGFGGPIVVHGPTTPDAIPGVALQPRVAVADDGTTTVVWLVEDGATSVVQAAVRAPGDAAFGETATISATDQTAYDPDVAVAPDGTTTVVWQRYDPPNGAVLAATRAPGATSFQAPVVISDAGQNALEPRVAVASDGATTVVWRVDDGVTSIVQVAVRDAGAPAFQGPANLSPSDQIALEPRVAMAADGTTTVVWCRSDGANSAVQATVRASGSPAFDAPVNVSQTGAEVRKPQVVAAPDGTIAISWLRSDGVAGVVQAALRTAGSVAFQSPTNLSAPNLDDLDPHLVAAPDGAISAVWGRSDGTMFTVRAAWTANVPSNRTAPSVTGTPSMGATLSCNPGAWTHASTLGITWSDQGTQIGAGPSLTLTERHSGATITCDVTASNADGAATARSAAVSVPTWVTPSPKEKAAPEPTAPSETGRGPNEASPPPRFLARPRLLGRLRLGRALTCAGVRSAHATTLTIEWRRNGRSIRRTPAGRYRITSRDMGALVTCRATLTGPGGTASALAPARRIPCCFRGRCSPALAPASPTWRPLA